MALYDTLEANQNWYAHVEDAMGDPDFSVGATCSCLFCRRTMFWWYTLATL